ncbi:helix-turn-helix domain-containing protein [Nonomuraea maheshkhaliensis]|uniref:helix-turn-helix domain-containing protein n=1 Tax=Nonomuraea maheshkhaliensis TaxID=419590 RepID=UPI003D15BD9A
MTLERRTWRTLEPLHGMIYFSPDAHAAYQRLGLTGRDGVLRLPGGRLRPGLRRGGDRHLLQLQSAGGT